MIKESAFTTLDRIAEITDKVERRKALRDATAKHRGLAILVQYAYHPTIKFDLPADPIPARLLARVEHDNYTVLYNSIRKLKKLFVGSDVPEQQKQMIWVGIINSVTKSEGDILLAIKDRRLPWKTLNKAFVVRALPELFPADMQQNALQIEEETGA